MIRQGRSEPALLRPRRIPAGRPAHGDEELGVREGGGHSIHAADGFDAHRRQPFHELAENLFLPQRPGRGVLLRKGT
jgi:hypothetical protein